LVHYIPNQAVKGLDAVLDDTAAEDFGTADIPGGEVDPGSLSLILVLDERWSSWSRRNRRMLAMTRLNAGLLVGGEHIIIGPEGCPCQRPW
jgi:hypothetical protein